MIFIGWTLILVSLFFMLSSIIGVIRMPDFYTKLHATSIADSFAIPLLLFGLALVQSNSKSFKFILLAVFLMIVSPLSTHILACAAWSAKLVPWRRK